MFRRITHVPPDRVPALGRQDASDGNEFELDRQACAGVYRLPSLTAGPGGDVTAGAALVAGLAKASGLNYKTSRVLVAFVVLCLIAGLAFLAGERRASHPMVLTGIPAAIGQDDVASVTVNGWTYGISGRVKRRQAARPAQY
jgi:hypothetical protein